MYLVVSTGFTTSEHFCKGEKQETIFFTIPSKEKDCPVCIAKSPSKIKEDTCCKLEVELNKIDNSFSNKLQKQNDVKSASLTIPFTIEIAPFLSTKVVELKSGNFTHPNFFLKKNPLYIFHCVYRI